jgi:arginine decarboxylase
MDIKVAGGIGYGPTELAAFDHALVKTGVNNFNLICLSSVIPPGSIVRAVDEPLKVSGEWGDKLYVVMAEQRTSVRDMEVWAGVGWIMNEETGKGLLVEHEGHSQMQVEHDIEHSLSALIQNRPGETFGPAQMKVIGATCQDKPVCALVVAAFESAGWQTARKQ